MNCLCCHCGRPAQRAGRRTGFVASPRSCECLCGPGLRSFSPRFCWSDTEPHTVFVLCQSVLRCVRPWVTLFQLFSNILHLFKCNAIDQSSVSESFLSTDFYRKWFSSNIPHDMLPACLPAFQWIASPIWAFWVSPLHSASMTWKRKRAGEWCMAGEQFSDWESDLKHVFPLVRFRAYVTPLDSFRVYSVQV